MLELAKKLVEALINGDGTLAVIIVLLAVIAGLVFAVIKLWRDNKDKQSNYADIATEYTNNLVTIIKGSNAHHKITADALQKIEVNKRGKVRRARIFYFRDLTGKKARIKERKR